LLHISGLILCLMQYHIGFCLCGGKREVREKEIVVS
jgi:hypothetical protein